MLFNKIDFCIQRRCKKMTTITHNQILSCTSVEKVDGGHKLSIQGYDNVVGFINDDELMDYMAPGAKFDAYVYMIHLGNIVVTRRYLTTLRRNVIDTHWNLVASLLKSKDTDFIKYTIASYTGLMTDDDNIRHQCEEEVRYLENVLENV